MMKKGIAMLFAAIIMLAFCAMASAEDGGRTIAPYTFTLVDGEDQYYENLIFPGDVIISGTNAGIFFVNCAFEGNVINTGDAGNKVFLLDSELKGQCVFVNSVQETTIDAPFPKFIVNMPVEAVAEDCFGCVIAIPDVPLTFNGDVYTLADAQVFYDAANPEAGFIPYEGQEANVLTVCQWWENGEKKMFIECEFDAGS